jgi:LysR family glycine cleavage system transcriptional activator
MSLPSGFPPMATLRAIEAAVRLGSFTAAAQELNISQSAISQAVRQFEARNRVDLFRRLPGRIEPTPEALDYAATLASALDAIRDAHYRLAGVLPRRLTVGIIRSLFHNWLLPRLPDFARRHPDIQATVISLGREIEEARACDIALFLAKPGDAPAGAIRVADEELIAVASPLVAHGLGGMIEDRLDADVALLGTAWPIWRSAAGVQPAAVGGTIGFRETSAILEAAIMGQGIGLVPRLACQVALERGDLVRMSNIPVTRGRSYWLLRAETETCGIFSEWLISALAHVGFGIGGTAHVQRMPARS